jgi:NTE family protein
MPAQPVIGIALAGGGPLAAMYEIGALAALSEAIDGLDLNAADTYIGISAGAIVAAALANGITPQEMCRLFIETDEGAARTAPAGAAFFRPELLMSPAVDELRKRALALPRLLGEAAWHYTRHLATGKRRGLLDSFERLGEALPTGILSGKPLERYIAGMFRHAGRSNDFRKLGRRLHIVATDLDAGKPVVFGGPGWDDVPISLAAQASSAVPGLFAPVEIKGRHFVDGALRKTMHASLALEGGVDLLFCLNPIVPYDAHERHGPGKLAAGGLVDVLSQTIRAVLHSRVEIGMAGYPARLSGRRHPAVRTEPRGRRHVLHEYLRLREPAPPVRERLPQHAGDAVGAPRRAGPEAGAPRPAPEAGHAARLLAHAGARNGAGAGQRRGRTGRRAGRARSLCQGGEWIRTGFCRAPAGWCMLARQ